MLIGTRLQLYGFYLLDTGESLARKIGLLRAFDLAKSLINNLQQLDATANIIKYSPSTYFRMATLAALFILGKQAFKTPLRLLRRASLEDNDLPGRTSRVTHGKVAKSPD